MLTLSNGQTITIPVGQSSASSVPFNVRADDAYTQGTDTLSVGVSTTSGGNFEALTTTSTVSTTVTDDADATTVTLTASAASVTEGGSIVYTATLNNRGHRLAAGAHAVQRPDHHHPGRPEQRQQRAVQRARR